MNKNAKIRRHRRVRTKVNGTADRPRVSVYRSNKALYVQLIDDSTSHTLLAINTNQISSKGQTKVMAAQQAGKKLAQLAAKKKITRVVFDRGGYRYHGRVKALAEGLRQGGLDF